MSDDPWDGPLVCCLCLFARTGETPPAVTIINGLAVCLDHVGYAQQGEPFASALAAVYAQEGRPS